MARYKLNGFYIRMYYPVASARERSVHLGFNYRTASCMDRINQSYSAVAMPQFDGKTTSIWGVSTSNEHCQTFMSKTLKRITIDYECIFMNTICENFGHYLAIFYKYLRYTANNIILCMYEDLLPENIKSILNKIYPTKILFLERNTIYDFNKLYLLFYISDSCIFLYYDHSVYLCRQQIINYIDYTYKNIPCYDKIILAKRESHLTKSQVSKNGLAGDQLVNEYINNGFFNIDTYKTNILDIIYYLRSAKEIVISYGTTLYCHMPYFSKNTKVTVLFNTECMTEYGNVMSYATYQKLFKDNIEATNLETKYLAPEYCHLSMYYLIFLEKVNYKIGLITSTSTRDTIKYVIVG